MSADQIVALIGIVMVLALVSSGSVFRNMPWQRKALYGGGWAVIIVALWQARQLLFTASDETP